MATLIASVPNKFDPNSSKIIFFDNVPTNTQFSPPGATVTFPFHAVFESEWACSDGGTGVAPAAFTVTVRRRGPLTGMPQSLETIAKLKVLIPFHQQQPPCHVEKDFEVTVTLPGGLNAVEIVAEINFGPGLGKLDKTVYFPSSACEQPAFDKDCMLIAVAPTALVIPNVIPFSIIYEPPGNLPPGNRPLEPGDRCSHAWIQDSHSVGVQMSLTQTGSEERDALIDIKTTIEKTPIEDSHTRQVHVNNETRVSSFELSDGVKRGTAFDGAEACSALRRDGPDKHGPGLGDKLTFLTNAQFFYWDTANLSNYRYPPVSKAVGPDGEKIPAPKPEFAYAWELRNFLLGDPEALPDWLQGATEAQICELARLDPFIQLPPEAQSKCALPPFPRLEDCLRFQKNSMERVACERDFDMDKELSSERFAYISDWSEEVEVTNKKETKSEFQTLSAGSLARISKEEPGKTKLSEAINGTAYVASGVTKLSGKIPDISSDVIEGVLNALTSFYTVKSVITTTVTMTRNDAINDVNKTTSTQTLFFKDNEDPHASFVLYYDKLFGTILSKRRAHGHPLMNAALASLDQLGQTTSIVVNAESTIPLSKGIVDLLTSQTSGPLSFDLAHDEDYEVAKGTKKGLPAGLTLNPSTGAVSGTPMVDSGQLFEALVVVSDSSSGDDIASISMNIDVKPPPLRPITDKLTITQTPFFPTGSSDEIGQFVQQLTVQNKTGSNIEGPVYLILTGLNLATQAVVNKAGWTANVPPPGLPFVVLNIGEDNVLGAGEFAQPVFLKVTSPLQEKITYTIQAMAGEGLPP
jgi:hypothetical protein